MIKQFEIDENEFLLFNNLELYKQSLHFDEDIEKRLSEFIEYLEHKLGLDYEEDNYNIEDMSLIRRIEFEKE